MPAGKRPRRDETPVEWIDRDGHVEARLRGRRAVAFMWTWNPGYRVQVRRRENGRVVTFRSPRTLTSAGESCGEVDGAPGPDVALRRPGMIGTCTLDLAKSQLSAHAMRWRASLHGEMPPRSRP